MFNRFKKNSTERELFTSETNLPGSFNYSLGKTLTILSFVLGGSLLAAIVWRQTSIDFQLVDPYQEVHVFGDNCQFTVGDWTENETFTALLEKSHDLKPIQLPLRRTKVIPLVKEHQFLLTQCPVNLGLIAPTGFALLNLGPIWGDSAVFLNGNLKAMQNDEETCEFSLLPEDRKSDSLVTIISKKNPGYLSPHIGPASILSFYFSDSREAIGKLKFTKYNYYNIMNPVFFMGYCLSLLVIFGISWLWGIRYNDVKWMINALALYAFAWGVYFAPFKSPTEKVLTVFHIFKFGALISLAAFLFHFLRIKKLRIPWEIVLVIGLATYTGLIFLLPNWLQTVIGMRSFLPQIIMFGLFLILGIHGIGVSQTLAGVRKTRVFIFSITALIGSFLYLTQAIFFLANGYIFERFVNFGVITIFAVFLSADLVVFHRQYHREKELRIIKENERMLLEEKLKIGRTVHELLLPGKMAGLVNGYEFSFFYQPASEMSGDWIYHWKNENGQHHIFVGDVLGKGPEAAVPVSAIISIVDECKRRCLSITETIQKINTSLLSLFRRKISTNLSAASFGKDGNLEIWTYGTQGWLVGEPGSLKIIRSKNNHILGFIEDITFISQKIQLPKGGMAIAFTDGCLEGSKALRGLLQALDYGDRKVTSLEDVINLVLETGKRNVLVDDQTIAVVRYLGET